MGPVSTAASMARDTATPRMRVVPPNPWPACRASQCFHGRRRLAAARVPRGRHQVGVEVVVLERGHVWNRLIPGQAVACEVGSGDPGVGFAAFTREGLVLHPRQGLGGLDGPDVPERPHRAGPQCGSAKGGIDDVVVAGRSAARADAGTGRHRHRARRPAGLPRATRPGCLASRQPWACRMRRGRCWPGRVTTPLPILAAAGCRGRARRRLVDIFRLERRGEFGPGRRPEKGLQPAQGRRSRWSAALSEDGGGGSTEGVPSNSSPLTIERSGGPSVAQAQRAQRWPRDRHSIRRTPHRRRPWSGSSDASAAMPTSTSLWRGRRRARRARNLLGPRPDLVQAARRADELRLPAPPQKRWLCRGSPRPGRRRR